MLVVNTVIVDRWLQKVAILFKPGLYINLVAPAEVPGWRRTHHFGIFSGIERAIVNPKSDFREREREKNKFYVIFLQ